MDPAITLNNWKCIKSTASQAIVTHQGTISHQHGVGLDHAAYLYHEKSILGISMLENAFHALDPEGIMNPGKLISSNPDERQGQTPC